VTIAGFEDVGRALEHARSERDVEVAFASRARRDGNDVSFNPIAGAGAHAATLHWTANDGALRRGDLLLVDAGAETETFYAADLTRTYPIGGTFTALQRDLLELLNDAHEAAIAAVVPDAPFRAFRHAAAAVIADGLADLGVLPAEGRDPDSGLHRRFTVCGPGHMLGLDVHDCADARAATYLDGVLAAGHVLTVEPGLYFQRDDETIPAELRGLGLRVEDDVVVTETGNRVLSDGLPRRAGENEAWL
jgi:Xaa-Pro aminopeptidase